MARRVAIVNDDQMFLELMETVLRDTCGYEVLVLHETTGAFPQLEAWHPDVIVLDLVMERPDSGWALLELVRLHPATRDVPVVVCSADVWGLREREEHLRLHGCVPLPKPFHLEELLDLLGPALDSSQGATAGP